MNEMTSTAEAGTGLTIPEGTALAAAFSTPEAADALFERVKAAAMSEAPDLTTASGRKRIASLAHKVARAKTAVDDAGKSLAEDAKKTVAAIDASRRGLRDRFDALKVEVRAPLTAWEAAEDARIAALDLALAQIQETGIDAMSPSDVIRAEVERVTAAKAGPEGGWQEKAALAEVYADAALSRLALALTAAETRERQEAELADLRAAAAERDRLEAERRAADEARAAEEAKAAAEAERESRERQEEADRAERAVQEAKDRAEREAQEAAARQEREAREAVEREAETKRREAAAAEAAAQAERDRIQAAADREAAEARRREQDRAHRGKIMGEAKAALIEAGLPEAAAKAAVLAIVAGSVPHVEIRF